MYDFLKNFHSRMRNVSAAALLHKSITQKDSLNITYGFKEYDEQVNLVYSLLLYIMNQSLKEEDCTLEDMAIYLEEINEEYFKKDIERDDYRKMANYIVNEIVLNDGKMTFFNCLNVDSKEFEKVYVQLIAHKRTEDSNVATYYLTEEGYNLVLSSFEFEDNMKLTVHELVFKLNLENKNYDEALNDVKNIFALSKKQVQSLLDNIVRIKENVMTFTAEEYERSINESIRVIKEQDEKLKAHKKEIERRENELKELYSQDNFIDNEEEINIFDSLEKLSKIKKELSKIAYEHSKIMSTHFEFKEVYTAALLSSIESGKRQRIDVKEFEDEVLRDLSKLDMLELLLNPLFQKRISKKYNILNCLTPQKAKVEKAETSTEINLVMDEEAYILEKEEKQRQMKEKAEKYKNIVKVIFNYGVNNKNVFSLKELISFTQNCDEESEFDDLVPNVFMLREVLIELLFMKEFSIEQLKKDIKKVNRDAVGDGSFEPLKAIIELLDENRNFARIKSVKIEKSSQEDVVVVQKEGKTLSCRNLFFEIN